MQTLLIQVPTLGLYFPLRIDSSVIAYKVTVDSSGETITVNLREPTSKDLEMRPGEFLAKLNAAGFQLSRVGVLAENLKQYVVNGSEIEPITFVKKKSDWVMLAKDIAFLQAFVKANTLEGGSLRLKKAV